MPSLHAMTQEVRKMPKNAASKQVAARATSQSFLKSAEFISESDMESESESESDSDNDRSEESLKAKSYPTKTNGTKKTPSSVGASSEDEQGQESDDDSGSQSSESGSDSDSESEDTEDEDSEEHPSVGIGISETLPDTAKSGSSLSKHATAYTPPKGFTAVTTGLNETLSSSELFSPSNLAGKYVWYITAPASVPISTVKQVSLQDVQQGKVALSLNGHDYGFVQGQTYDKFHTKIMIPDARGKAYRISKRPIDQTLHLQQIYHLQALPNQSASPGTAIRNASKTTSPATKAIRQQPQGLKMRFRPIGFGRGKLGMIGSGESSESDSDVDEEMDDAPPFKQPRSLYQPKSGAGRSARETSESSDVESSSSGENVQRLQPSRKATITTTNKSTHPGSASDTSSSDDESTSSDEDIEDVGVLTKKITTTAIQRPISVTSSGSEDNTSESLEHQRPSAQKLSNSYKNSLKRKVNDRRGGDTLSHPSISSDVARKELKGSKANQVNSPIKRSDHTASDYSHITLARAMHSPISSRSSKIALQDESSPAPPHPTSQVPIPSQFHVHAGRARSPSITSQFRPRDPTIQPSLLKTNGTLPQESHMSPAGTGRSPELPRKGIETLEDQILAIDPSLSEEQRKAEVRRLRRNENSRVYKQKKRQVQSGLMAATPDNTTKESPSSSVALPTPIVNHLSSAHQISKDASQLKSIPRLLHDQMSPSSPATPKKKKIKQSAESDIGFRDDGHIPLKTPTVSSVITPMRKESMILPPKSKYRVSK